ncbi:MAG TPA: hypothetical protein VMR41_05960 [Patescibacteria group bacterium]|nr:hypothetical protein [Patescibacteria group bacterium]
MYRYRPGFTDIKKLPPIKRLKTISQCCHFIRNCIIELHTSTFDTFKINLPKGLKVPPDLKGEELFNFIEKTLPKEYPRLIWREIVMGLLNDYLHFTYTSLREVDNFNITVSYYNMRKPFQDTLKHLEYLLADTEAYLNKFLKNSSELDNDLKNVNKPKLKEHLNKVLEYIPVLNRVEDLIYKYRYDTTGTAGLYDQSIHLFTSREGIRTEKSNINFVYLNRFNDLVEQHSEHIYRVHLLLLLYSLELFSIHLFLVKNYEYNNLLRLRAWMCLFIGLHSVSSEKELDYNIINPLSMVFDIACINCKNYYSFNNYKDYKRFVFEGFYYCVKCQSGLLMGEKLIIPGISKNILESMLEVISITACKLINEKIKIKYEFLLPITLDEMLKDDNQSFFDKQPLLNNLSAKQLKELEIDLGKYKKILKEQYLKYIKELLYKFAMTKSEIDTQNKIAKS